MSALQNLFSTQSGYEFPGLSSEVTSTLRSKLLSQLNLTPTHITEAASYSLAMVARYALGLSAERADVCVLANQSLSGAVSLATMRHLYNAGANSKLFYFKSASIENGAEKELRILKEMGIVPHMMDESNITEQDYAALIEAISASHNLVLGLYQQESKTNYKRLIEILNEASTPVHCVDCPLGIDPDSGSPSASPLFASSTLSLGTVYAGLFSGDTYAGRHYLCDISLSKELYRSAGLDLAPLFSEQPVIPIFPKKPKEEED
jgi:NAD(P)H-hydrate repair Nnr-like enzyme with NAD(P)H-hydrate epimerase domain